MIDYAYQIGLDCGREDYEALPYGVVLEYCQISLADVQAKFPDMPPSWCEGYHEAYTLEWNRLVDIDGEGTWYRGYD